LFASENNHLYSSFRLLGAIGAFSPYFGSLSTILGLYFGS
jgi:biopolymer transport protein ExbB/TolQ